MPGKKLRIGPLTGEWSIVTWYEFGNYGAGDMGSRREVVGYAADQDLAKAWAIKRGGWGGDLDIKPVTVLTDGKVGYVLHGTATAVKPNDPDKMLGEIRAEATGDVPSAIKNVLGLP